MPVDVFFEEGVAVVVVSLGFGSVSYKTLSEENIYAAKDAGLVLADRYS